MMRISPGSTSSQWVHMPRVSESGVNEYASDGCCNTGSVNNPCDSPCGTTNPSNASEFTPPHSRHAPQHAIYIPRFDHQKCPESTRIPEPEFKSTELVTAGVVVNIAPFAPFAPFADATPGNTPRIMHTHSTLLLYTLGNGYTLPMDIQIDPIHARSTEDIDVKNGFGD